MPRKSDSFASMRNTLARRRREGRVQLQQASAIAIPPPFGLPVMVIKVDAKTSAVGCAEEASNTTPEESSAVGQAVEAPMEIQDGGQEVTEHHGADGGALEMILAEQRSIHLEHVPAEEVVLSDDDDIAVVYDGPHIEVAVPPVRQVPVVLVSLDEARIDQSVPQDRDCCACLVAPACVLVVGCGHLVFCAPCAKLSSSTAKVHRCPFCPDAALDGQKKMRLQLVR